jgi:hypothetical protein
MGELLLGFFVVPLILVLLFNAFTGSGASSGTRGPSRHHTKGCNPSSRLPEGQ